MTIRLRRASDPRAELVAIDGWLSAAEVGEVEGVVGVAGSQGSAVSIDLTHLTGADATGLAALLDLRARGMALTGASPYVELLLERAAGGTGRIRPGPKRPGDR